MTWRDEEGETGSLTVMGRGRMMQVDESRMRKQEGPSKGRNTRERNKKVRNSGNLALMRTAVELDRDQMLVRWINPTGSRRFSLLPGVIASVAGDPAFVDNLKISLAQSNRTEDKLTPASERGRVVRVDLSYSGGGERIWHNLL